MNIFKKYKSDKDSQRFQEIQDQRYRENLKNLHNELNVPERDNKEEFEEALKTKKTLDMEKDTIFLKKWE